MILKELFTDDDAVSPVIGIILMVAITVILAAVIASFVLGLGQQTDTQPQASFGFSYDEGAVAASGAGELTITHQSGDSIKVTELFVRGSGLNGDTGDWNTLGGDASSTISSTSAVAAGDSVTLDGGGSGVTSDYDVSVVYQSEEDSKSTELASDTGPDA